MVSGAATGLVGEETGIGPAVIRQFWEAASGKSLVLSENIRLTESIRGGALTLITPLAADGKPTSLDWRDLTPSATASAFCTLNENDHESIFSHSPCHFGVDLRGLQQSC